jgi:hypothetical protein
MMLKNLFRGALTLGLLFGLTTAQAQSKLPPRRPATPPKRLAANNAGVKDGATMKGGVIIFTELGRSTPLAADKKLVNGTTITTSGLVTTPDGTTTQINEGDHVSLTGRLTTRTEIVEADSLRQIKAFDLKYPGKRKKMEAERERREKQKIKTAEAKAKAKRKR